MMQAPLLSLLFCLAAGKVNVYTPPVQGILDPVAFADWIVASAADGFDVLQLSPGAYNVTQAPSSSAHLVLTMALNSTIIDFGGSVLTLQHRQGAAIIATNLWGSALQNVTIFYAQPTSNTAVLDTIDPAGHWVDVTVPDGHPLEDWQNSVLGSCIIFDRDTWLIKPGNADMEPGSVLLNQSGNGSTFRVTWEGGPFPPGTNGNYEVGDMLACRMAGGQNGINVLGCEDSLFQDITLYGAGCFGFFQTGSSQPGQRGGNTFRRISLRRPGPIGPAGFPPMLSSSADGFHNAEVRRGPIIEDSHFEFMADDGIAIHGRYTVITGVGAGLGTASPDIIVQAGGYTDDFMVGDRVRMYSPLFVPVLPGEGGAETCTGGCLRTVPPPLPPFYYTITDVAPVPAGYVPPFNVSTTIPAVALVGPFRVLSLDSPIPPAMGFDWIAVNADRKCDGFVLRNNTILNHRARGMLVKASNGLIYGNIINGSSMGGIIITPELYWAEADWVTNLTVSGNRIMNVGYGMQGYGGIALGAFTDTNAIVAATGHSEVHILNNSLQDVHYAPLWLTSSGNVTVAGNNITSPFSGPATANPLCCENIPSRVVAWASNINNLSVANNCVSNPGSGTLGIWNVTQNSVSGDYAEGVVLCQ